MLPASAGRRLVTRLFMLGCLYGLAGAAEARPAAPAERVVAIAADLSGDGSRGRITVTLSKPVAATTFLLEKPDRAVIELPEVNFQVRPENGRSRLGPVAAFRFGLFAPGRSRLVVDLDGPALVSRVEAREGPGGSSLLTVELVRTDRETFRRAATADQADLSLTTGSLPSGPAPDTRPVIAIDAGHGGVDPGAKAPNGALEKDITFAFAEILRDRLAAGGRYRLLMVRDHDVFVPLDERVRRAREAGANLFLSIHADTISNPQVSGATIYTGGERASDLESASLAERENAADQADGTVRTAPPAEVTDILHELTIRETRGFSARFSSLLLSGFARKVRLSPHPQREAGFRVLRSADLPSVLVELGYLSNARDLELMLSPEWRKRTADSMAGAVDRFFSARVASRAPISP